MNADELFALTQGYQEGLRRHRREVSKETPAERTRRQEHRAQAIAQELGSTRRSVVKAIFALVVADEAPDPKGDPPEPIAPGARAVHKPKPKAKNPPLQTATPVTQEPQETQETLW